MYYPRYHGLVLTLPSFGTESTKGVGTKNTRVVGTVSTSPLVPRVLENLALKNAFVFIEQSGPLSAQGSTGLSR